MQKVKIADVSVKKGTNDKGPWTNTRVTGEDGAIFGTFSDSAQYIGKGDLIELEPVVKGKNINFSDWNMLEKGTGASSASGTPAPANGGGYKKDIDGMRAEYVMKARLQAIERASIEAQTAYNGIISLAAGVGPQERFPDDSPILEALSEAIAWARQKMAATLVNQAPSEAAGATPEAPQPDVRVETSVSLPYVEPEEPFPHIGALLAWCNTYGVDRPTFFEITNSSEKTLPQVNIGEAFGLVKAHIISKQGDQAEAQIFGKEA